MKTAFSLAQLADPDIAEADKILRACVHCGFCTATCPTYTILGDELDSPRGRIYLIKDMLEGDKPASDQVATHLDRCLTCLSCMTTCPSGVHYQHLVDIGRKHVEATRERPKAERLLRDLLAWVLPHPGRFRLALVGAMFAKPFAKLAPKPLQPLLAMAPRGVPSPSYADKPQTFRAEGERRMRVALLSGCAQQVVAPGINEATVRLLTRHGCDVVVAPDVGCCGALTHHLGREDEAAPFARANIAGWLREADGEGLDAIVVNASGCGTHVKDYGHLFRNTDIAADAARVSALAKDVTEVMQTLGLKPTVEPVADVAVTYHSACSMQHGQKLKTGPQALLRQAGFTVSEPRESHICCGSAGTYNLLQPELAGKLRERKLANIARTAPDVIATGNVGCMTQLTSRQQGGGAPVVHTVALLDWATGGPKPAGL